MCRRESRGLHYNVDHGTTNPAATRDTVLAPSEGPIRRPHQAAS